MIIGIVIGVMLPLTFGILSEYLPINYRGFTLIVIWCFYGLGGLYVNITMNILMPTLNYDKTNQVIFYLSLPYLFFSFSYLTTNAALAIASISVPLLRTDLKCFEDDCYPLAFGVSTGISLIAFILFLIGTPFYFKEKKLIA
jgi:MFS family permease